MAQLVSGLDAVYRTKKSSWQDTTVPPNVLLHFFGPLEASLDLQTFVDVPQIRHRESMKGQTSDIPNLQFLFKVPNTNLLILSPDDITSGSGSHRDSLKGQTAGPQNFLILTQIFNTSQPRPMVINPVFNKHPTQETTIQRNPVLDVIVPGALPFFSPVFENEQAYCKDSLGGQYGRNGAVVVIGVPPAFNEIFTFVPRLKTAQEPYVFPNVVILGIPANAPPFILMQGEDRDWRGKKTQEPYGLPNVLALTKPVTQPFVHTSFEDHQWRGKKTQETYTYPNLLTFGPVPQFFSPIVWENNDRRGKKTQETYNYPNNLILQIATVYTPPFVQQQYEHHQWRSHKTQEHYDWPNVIASFPPPFLPPIRVMATQVGFFADETRNIGDVFDIPFLAYADAAHDYIYPAIGWPLFGWMVVVAPNTPLVANAPTPLNTANKPRTIL